VDAPASARTWTAAALAAAAPAVVIICAVIWRSPYPITEAVALFEDVSRPPMTRFLVPELAYYRPLYHLTVGAIWRTASLATALDLIKAVHVAAILALVLAMVRHLRPSTRLDAAAALVAVSVVLGSPGFRDNLELPLLYTIVGMPLIVLVWMLLQRSPRWWHAPAIVTLTVVAVGFKEQGLVVVAVALAAWWTGAPGARRGVTVALGVIAAVYVAARLRWRGEWAMFEQSIGFGFSELMPADAEARFGAFPFGIYAYNSASTIANVLFAEPTRGIFRITRAVAEGRLGSWQVIHLSSSVALTAVIAWWGWHELRRVRAHGWAVESRLCLALVAALLASGALSFNYSRDRLGGMAVPFYAMAAYFALRAAAARALAAPRRQAIAIGVLLFLLAAGWQVRTLGTVEHVRANAWRNHQEWFVLLHDRRAEFAQRPVYLRIMAGMERQGRDAADVPRRLQLPPSLATAILEP
jgi:hypothetical protein